MLALIISIVTCILIIASIILLPNLKIKNFNIPTYLIVSVIGAVILLCSKQVSFDNLKVAFINDNAMNPWKILVLFISMTVLSVFLDEIGFFKYLANQSMKIFAKNQFALFIGFYIFLSILTIFTSNDIIILTFTPFICYFTKNAKINPIPYLVSEFVASNTWSMVLIVGNPTNIYLASSFNIDFIEYIKMMFLPTLGGSIISLGLLLLIFSKKLKEKMEIELLDDAKPNIFLTIIGLIHLLGCIVLIAISNYLNLPMWLITLSFCASLTLIYIIYKLVKKNDERYMLTTYKRAPWSLIPFVLSMFIIVLSLKEQGYVTMLHDILGEDNVFTYGYSGAVFANLINNIPMSVLYSEILVGSSIKSVYASIIASNIAAFISPFGALAGIMWLSLLKKFEIKYTFLDFIKYGVIIGIPTLSISLFILFLI